jgi:hypothetical protein
MPMLWMIVPFVLIIGELQFHYGYRALAAGDTTVLEVELARDAAEKPGVTLEAGAGLRVETPAVWIPSSREMAWRIAVEKPGTHHVLVHAGNESLVKEVAAEPGVRRRSPRRPSSDFVDQVLYPAETPVPAGSAVHSISVDYPEAEILGTHWMVSFFVLSIVFAFALRGLMGVTL